MFINYSATGSIVVTKSIVTGFTKQLVYLVIARSNAQCDDEATLIMHYRWY